MNYKQTSTTAHQLTDLLIHVGFPINICVVASWTVKRRYVIEEWCLWQLFPKLYSKPGRKMRCPPELQFRVYVWEKKPIYLPRPIYDTHH